ncbi:MlaD family protein [Methylothermus subterraneus]
MSKSVNPTLIGAFVLGAVAISFVALLLFAGGTLWSERERCVVYFSESVNGLNLGAPVKMRGVQVGKVTEILVQYQPKARTLTTPVVLEVDLEPLKIEGKPGFPWQRPALGDLIQEGLRAQLKLQSLVTGQLYVDLDFHPETPMRLVGAYKGLAEIPSIPSSQEEIENTISDLVREIRQLPLQQTMRTVNSTLSHLEEILSQPQWKTSIQKLDQALDRFNHLTTKLESRLDQVGARLDQNLAVSQSLLTRIDAELAPLLQQGRGTLQQAEQTFRALTETLGPNASAVTDFVTTLEEVRSTAREMRVLTEMLQTQPEALLRGKPENQR